MRNRPQSGEQMPWRDEPEVRLDEPGRYTSRYSEAGSVSAPPARAADETQVGALASRRRRRAVVAGLVAVALLVAVAHRNTGVKRQPAPIAAPSPRALPPRGTARTVEIAQPVAVLPSGSTAIPPGSSGAVNPHVFDVAVSQGWIYLLRSDPTFSLIRTNPDSSRQYSTQVSTGANRLAVDGSALWLAADSQGSQPSSTRVQRYDSQTLSPAGPEVVVPGTVAELVAADSMVWVATSAGLYTIRDDQHALAVHTVEQAVGAIALDPANHRLVAALPQVTGTELIAVDTTSEAVIMTGHLPLVDVSLAVASGNVWYAGFGDPGGYGGIGVLQPASLDPGRDRSDELSVGPGARIFAGDAVIWVNSTGNGLTSCVDSQDGKVLATWSGLIGPISSALGIRVSVGENSALFLSLTGGCTG